MGAVGFACTVRGLVMAVDTRKVDAGFMELFVHVLDF
jgi:hypothetical protein